MPVCYDENKRIFSLHTKNTTYQFMADKYGYLIHLYYGKKSGDDYSYLLTYRDRGFSGNPYAAGTDRTYSPDVLPQEYPTCGTGDYRNTALVIENADGSFDCDLHYVSHRILKGKYALPGLPATYANSETEEMPYSTAAIPTTEICTDAQAEGETLEVILADDRTGARVTLLYGILPDCDVITRSVRVENTGTARMIIRRLYSACLDFLGGRRDCISFYGRHMMERNVQRSEIVHGTFRIGSTRGASSHQYNPLLFITDRETTEKTGNAYALSFVYSGCFDAKTEKDQFDQTRILMGLSDETFAYAVEPGEDLFAPEVVMSYTSDGLTALSHNLHDCVRHHICRGPYRNRRRPVLVNSWEANYFRFNSESLLKLADKAQALGIEMLVMDDGWFSNRNDDNTSLGDWEVNEEKLGCSLNTLVTEIKKRGLLFGIWIEPEMVSENSNLYRQHPEWVLRIPGKDPTRSRNQLVLDFANPAVTEYMYEQIANVLKQADIAYVKWDMNRSLSDVYSTAADKGGTPQGAVLYDYVRGVYALADKLTKTFPEILWEGCAGGGGRFDMGMLYYTPQIWCSDNTDALDRCEIQYGTSFAYPLPAIAAHVSAVPNHQTGRTIDMHTRGVVAMMGTLGYELDLNKLTPAEEEEITEQIKVYKELAPLLLNGLYYRLSNPSLDGCDARGLTDRERKNVYCSLVVISHHANAPVLYLKPAGLDPEALYQDMESGQLYSGQALMETGLPVPALTGDYPTFTWHFCRQDET